MAAMSNARLVAAAVVLSLVALRNAHAKGGKPAPAPPAAEWSEEDGRTVVKVTVGRGMKAYFQAPATLPEGDKKGELIVILHGHGGTATGMLHFAASVGEPRNAFVLACEGSTPLKTDQGVGHQWSPADVDGILGCVDATTAKHPIDTKRVLLMGHSAGGTMSLSTHGRRPSAFAGIVTTASPEMPGVMQKGARVATILGTKDANFSQASLAISVAEKTVVGRLLAVTGLPHELPHVEYARECAAWVLDGKGGSDTLRVPLQPGDEVVAVPDTPSAKAKGRTFRHVLVFAAGGRGAPGDAVPRADAKAKAAEIAAKWKKAPPGTDFGADVATLSQDPLTKDTRGVISGQALARYGGTLVVAMSKLKGGDVSAPVESDAGWHVVVRDP
jgi:predicted esterase